MVNLSPWRCSPSNSWEWASSVLTSPLVSLLHSIASVRLVKAFNSASISCLPGDLPVAPWPFGILRNLWLICLNVVSFFQGRLQYSWAVIVPLTAFNDPTNAFNLDFPNFNFQFTQQYKLRQCHKSSSVRWHVTKVWITNSISKHERLGNRCMGAQQNQLLMRQWWLQSTGCSNGVAHPGTPHVTVLPWLGMVSTKCLDVTNGSSNIVWRLLTNSFGWALTPVLPTVVLVLFNHVTMLALAQLGVWNNYSKNLSLRDCQGSSDEPKAGWPGEPSHEVIWLAWGGRSGTTRPTESSLSGPLGLSIYTFTGGWGHPWS